MDAFEFYVSQGCQLEPAGERWRAPCPFPDHNETKPSFMVYPDGGFHCFGCGKHGNSPNDFLRLTGQNAVFLVPMENMKQKPFINLDKLFNKEERNLDFLMHTKDLDKVLNLYDKLDIFKICVREMMEKNKLTVTKVSILISKYVSKLKEYMNSGKENFGPSRNSK